MKPINVIKQINESYDMYNVVEDAVMSIKHVINDIKQNKPSHDEIIDQLEKVIKDIESNSNEA